MGDNMDSDKREQINKNNKVKVSDIVKDLKLGKSSSHKNVDNVETESEKNLVYISVEKDSVVRDYIHENYDVTFIDVGE